MQPSLGPVVLDELDLRLLSFLQSDASLTNAALAERVHASQATCLRRVKALKDSGMIEREVAILAPHALGANLTAIVEVTLDAQNAERLDLFEALLAQEPAVTQCYRVSPGPDFVLILIVSDMPAFHSLAQRLFSALNHVRNLRTFFSVKRSKFEPSIPLPRP